jgi:hypothetical protein
MLLAMERPLLGWFLILALHRIVPLLDPTEVFPEPFVPDALVRGFFSASKSFNLFFRDGMSHIGPRPVNSSTLIARRVPSICWFSVIPGISVIGIAFSIHVY